MTQRRQFIGGLLGAAAGTALTTNSISASSATRKKVAAIVTEYRHYSHADVIVGRMLNGYTPNNVRVEPRTEIVSMYTDQVPANDLSRAAAAKYGFKIYPTVAEALTLGGDKLAVDAVLLIGEHGNYPVNEKGQKLYPRHEFFQQIVQVFRRSGHGVPVFSDKHLSYSWPKAKERYDTARALKFPLMAGSSMPVTLRLPELSLPLGTEIEHAMSVGYIPNEASGLESYGLHALEALQCMIERRRGAETGIAAVETLSGEAVWRWRDSTQGRWSAPLLEAALACFKSLKPGPLEQQVKNGSLFRLEYREGFQAAVYMLGQHIDDVVFAAQIKGQARPVATLYDTSVRELPHFDGLVDCIEQFFMTGKPLYPVERTLLTTGALAYLLEAKQQGRRIETPDLNVRYRAPHRDHHQHA